MTIDSDPIRGILAAVPTPFTADGHSIDLHAIGKLVEFLIESGIHGVVTTGTTGEFPALTEDEHKQVIKAYCDAVAGRIPVVAGTGALSTRKTIELSQYAQQAGASCCMVVPPFYDPLPFEELVHYYTDVCASITIPVMYYNVPGATGIHLDARQIRELGQRVPGLRYVKDTSGNAKEQVDVLTNATSSSIVLCNGWDTLTFAALAHGAQAIVLGASTVIPKECVDFYDTLVVRGNLIKARQQWKFLWDVLDYLESVNYPAGVKAGLKIRGLDMGPTRAPVRAVSQQDYARFEALLAKSPLSAA